jgi:hypothetical protein
VRAAAFSSLSRPLSRSCCSCTKSRTVACSSEVRSRKCVGLTSRRYLSMPYFFFEREDCSFLRCRPLLYRQATPSRSRTFQQHRHFQRIANAELFIATLFQHRDKSRFELHGFVVMPDHAPDVGINRVGVRTRCAFRKDAGTCPSLHGVQTGRVVERYRIGSFRRRPELSSPHIGCTASAYSATWRIG